MGSDPLQRAATISGKESGWTHFPQKQLGHDLQAKRISEDHGQPVQLAIRARADP